MTGPDPRGYERGTGTPTRSAGTQQAVGAILIVLALGLALRLILAYLLPGSGFDADLTSFRFWASDLARNGLHGFYERDFFHDYTPGYLYVLWLVGTVGGVLGGVGDLIKIPPILADVALGYLVHSMIRELGGRERLALLGAVVVVVNPVLWFDSVVWGQVDSVGVVFLLLGLRSLWRDQPERAAIYTVIAAVVKPQLGILVPLVAVVTIRRALWPINTGPVPADAADQVDDGPAITVLDRIRGWEGRTDHAVRIVTTAVAGYLTAVILCAPFGLSVLEVGAGAPFLASGLIDQIVVAGSGYPFLTVNAYNIWAIVPGDLGASLANAGQWVCDTATLASDRCGSGVAQFGPVPAIAVGTGLLVLSILTVLVAAARRPDRLTLLVALAVLALAFFAAPTRVHERYGFPFFALGAILFAVSPRWRVAYVVLAIATFANMYVVLTTIYPPENPTLNPVRDWLGIGSALRSEIGVTVVALLHTAAFGWAWLQLRAGAHERLRDGLAESSLAATTKSWSDGPPVETADVIWNERRAYAEIGVLSWVRDRMRQRPIRADRSRTLRGEPGGRLDRLDVWFLVVLVLATMGMRTFRLAEPFQMHFDEVYHARTATEFLQAWRYGQSHDIYEWTHPHLAKYAMAAGIVLWGEDDVSATGRLDTPVRAVAIEHRSTDPLGDRAGERVHIATGDQIRTEDLRTRATISRISAPGASALALDVTGARLVVGFDDGSLAAVDLDDIGRGGTTGPTLTVLTSVEHPIRHVLVTDDGATIIAASDATVTAVDLRAATDPEATGDPSGVVILGSAELPDIADLANAGTGPALLATPGDIDQPAAVASTLAELIDGDPADYEARIAETPPDDTVVLGSPGSGEIRTAVEAAIADGRLPGIEIVDLPRVAVANADGVAFIDPATTGVSSTIEMDGGAHGMALVTGIDDLKLYVTTGTPIDPAYAFVAVGGDKAANGPTEQGRHPMPGLGTRVAYNEATQQVHVLGRVPAPAASGNASWTVYVIEPHGNPPANAVYADAALPTDLEPAGWALDVESQYPSDDRQDLLVFGADGQTASIDVGSHAFAWRFPGVIAGVLMAVCLYVLARILFQRRLVAGLVGLFVVLDGMLFVQSRIGMNDVYVGLFIVAAYTVFAALWTGWWRGRAAFWVALPIVGLLLGLALATKWVAAYAIGALVLLLLVRSALGRVLAILGLIGITSVLGYLAISVPPGQGVGNVLFLAIMIGLTLVAVVAAVFHPIAWSDEEMRLAVIAPTAAGALLFFGALALGRLEASVVLGPLEVTPLLGATAAVLGSLAVYGAFRVGAAFGFGPLAGPPAPGDPAHKLEPPAPAPGGWLRPGWLVGLPLVWATICLVAIPLGVYVASYLPWAAIENHRLWEGAPAGNTGQTLLELTSQMYGYHNGLTSAHPASSPWWAWPFDLKPVWFYQDGFAAGTGAAVYDAGNLVIWWFGFAALVFVSIMAFRRRSPALALIAIGFAAQWVSWARIDRASFQYHYYTALPFVILALAYLVAELWHGASRRTWLAVRITGAAAVLAPVGLWLLSRPLCGLVGVQIANPGSAACPAVIPDLVLTVRTVALLLVVAVGAYILGRGVLALQGAAEASDPEDRRVLRGVLFGAAAIGVAFVGVAFLPNDPVLTWRGIPVEPIAVIVALPIAWFAAQVFAARDARRFVIGLGVAVVAWFVVWYPNIAALPLPSAVVNAYQGLLPTYLYAFQFPVNTVPRTVEAPLLSPTLGILTLAIGLTCLVVAYSASVWRLALAESDAQASRSAIDPDSDASDDGVGGLARTGGGA